MTDERWIVAPPVGLSAAVLLEKKRFEMAFAEAGYPDTVVGESVYGYPRLAVHSGSVPDRIVYQAVKVVRGLDACFDCWSKDCQTTQGAHDCVHGAS